MKNLKTTIKLSVLALACLGAGALALQPTATAQAETEYADCIHMVNGAAVCVKDGFSGIRWKSKVRPAQYRAMVEAAKAENPDAKITIGTLVMPTDKIGADGELTEADIANGALNLTANINYDELATATEDVVFYTVVDFNAVADEDKQDAYAMELTAHSYIKIDDKYYFDNLGNYDVSRSARQVAWSAELDGDLDEMTTEKADKAAAYYNPNGTRHQITEENKNTGAAGTAFIDLNNGATPEQTVDVAFTLPENEVIKEVLIDTENVDFAYSEGVLTLKIAEGQNFPTGETYVAICTDKGFYTEHIIGATMVITDTKGLEIFNAKGGYYEGSTKASLWDDGNYWRPEQEQSGYYVLGDNIDATGYVHGSKIALDVATIAPTIAAGKDKELGTDDDVKPGEFNDSTWNGAKSYIDKPIGLTGTFNGLGYKIDRITIGAQGEGFFGIVNGGTVKNVAFTNAFSDVLASSYILANYLINATIDNVYIATNEYDKNDKVNNPGFVYAGTTKSGALAAYAIENTEISNVFIQLGRGVDSVGVKIMYGALFGATHSSQSYTCENVFAYVRTHAVYVTETTTVDETTGTNKEIFDTGTAYYYLPMTVGTQATVGKDGNGQYTIVKTRGTLYLAENQKYEDIRTKNGTITISDTAYDISRLTGVYYYGQGETWALDKHDFSGFFASGCWKTSSSRGVAWKS